ADERSAMALAGGRDDRVNGGRWQPAADAQHPGARPADGVYDGGVLGGKGGCRRVEADVVGAELDRDQGRLRRLDGAELLETPGGFRPAARHQVEVHAELLGHQPRESIVRRGREAAGTDAVPQGDIDL